MNKKFFGLFLAALIMTGTPAFAKKEANQDKEKCTRTECVTKQKCDKDKDCKNLDKKYCKADKKKCKKIRSECAGKIKKADKFCKALNLSEEQKTQVKKLREQMRKEKESIDARFNEGMKKILNADQLKKFEEMKAKKFEARNHHAGKPGMYKKGDKPGKGSRGEKPAREEK